MTNQQPPIVTGQRLQVLDLIRQCQPNHSFILTADNAFPEAEARISELKEMGFDVITMIYPEFEFRGHIKRNSAKYSLGTPEWPAPRFLDQEKPCLQG